MYIQVTNSNIQVRKIKKLWQFRASVQDIHVGDKNKTAFEKDWGSEVKMSSKSPESRGVAILFRGDLNFKVTETEKDDMGNLLLIKLQVCDLNFYLCVIYGPNIDCPEFYVNLRNRLMQKENLPVVICGDWNYVHPPGGWIYYFCFFRRPMSGVRCPASRMVSAHLKEKY